MSIYNNNTEEAIKVRMQAENTFRMARQNMIDLFKKAQKKRDEADYLRLRISIISKTKRDFHAFKLSATEAKNLMEELAEKEKTALREATEYANQARKIDRILSGMN